MIENAIWTTNINTNGRRETNKTIIKFSGELKLVTLSHDFFPLWTAQFPDRKFRFMFLFLTHCLNSNFKIMKEFYNRCISNCDSVTQLKKKFNLGCQATDLFLLCSRYCTHVSYSERTIVFAWHFRVYKMLSPKFSFDLRNNLVKSSGRWSELWLSGG